MSGARVQASETMLPGSTERVLSVSGVADAVHIAVYYVGMILVENQDRMPANTTYRPGHAGGPANAIGGGRSSIGGGAVGPAGGYYASGGHQSQAYGHSHGHSHSASGYSSSTHQPGSQTQQIYIPNDLVGAVIGKGGQKINEIRNQSATAIKIMEPGEGGQAASANERVSIWCEVSSSRLDCS